MSTCLITNADDLGLTPGINRAVSELHQAGALSSATLMANGPAFEDAVQMAQAHASLGIGCHIVLADGVPLSPPETIPSLLDPASSRAAPRLRSSLAAFAQAALLGKLNPDEIEREATAQIGRLLEAGLFPTHLDTHKHTHIFPSVLGPLLRVAKRLGVPALRNPFEPAWSLRLGAGSGLRRLQIRALGRLEPAFRSRLAHPAAAVHTTDGSLGVSATGDLSRSSLAALLAALPPGTWELVCHPGYDDSDLAQVNTRLRHHREVERKALLGLIPQATAHASRLQLVSFAALAPQPSPTYPHPAPAPLEAHLP